MSFPKLIDMKATGVARVTMDDLFERAHRLGALCLYQNSYNGLYQFTIHFTRKHSEISAKGLESMSPIEALESAIHEAEDLGARHAESRSRRP